MNSETKYPFYKHSKGQKRSVQIIKEAKAEIKKIESLRPSTPFYSRNLLTKGLTAISPISRPSSCVSIKSLKYEHDEKYIVPTSQKISCARSHKQADNIADLKLEPIVTKPVLRPRKSAFSSVRCNSNSEFSGFPPLTYEEKCNTTSTKSISEWCEKQFEGSNILKLDCISDDENSNYANEYFHDVCLNETDNSSSANSVCDTQLDNTNKRNRELEKLAEDLSFFFHPLEKAIKLGIKKRLNETILVVEEIYHLLKENNAFLEMHSNRIPLLKLLFKLLDPHYPDLSLLIIKLLLEMKVKDGNLSNVFRLLLKLLKDNCLKIIDKQLINIFLENMCEISIKNNKEATIYGIKVLKQIAMDHFVIDLTEKFKAALNHHLNELIKFFHTGREWDQNYNQIITQVLSTVHYLIDDEHTRKLVIKSDIILSIINVIKSFHQDADIIQIAVRLISKLIDKEGCECVTESCDELLLNFMHILETYKHNIDITLQITFIIGNLVSINENTAFMFMMSSNFISSTISLLEYYVQKHIKFEDKGLDNSKDKNSSGDKNWSQDIFEVILKVLSIWANACLIPKVGAYLAEQNNVITHLLFMLDSYIEHNSALDLSYALYSFLIVISNVSYYFQSDSTASIIIVDRVILLLDTSFPQEVRLESANIIRNLTRYQEIRKYIQEHNLLPEFVKLLSEDDKEFNLVAYGIIMNILIDQSTHHTFYKEQGLTRLLHKLHLCIERDCKTSTMLCQILWNYCSCKNSSDVLISKIEVKHLIKFLSYAICKYESKEGKGDDFEEWKNEFCPIADKLIKLLQTRAFGKS